MQVLHKISLNPQSLAAQVLDCMESGKLGLPVLAAAAEVVAASCRYNLWIADEITSSDLSEEGYLRLMDAVEANNRKCRAALKAFAEGGSQLALYRALSEVTAFLTTRRLLREIESWRGEEQSME
jgi:hypothetical protein